MPSLAALSPDAAILALAAGLALIAWELNRPGSILPGASGLLIALLAASSLLRRHPQPWAVSLVLLGAAILLLQLRRTVPLGAAALTCVALLFGFLHLLPPTAPVRIHPLVALLCAIFLGAGTTVLTRIARRARLNKGLD